jgi:hypothetical protein
MWEIRARGSGGRMKGFTRELFLRYGEFSFKDGRNGERCMYFVCDFNGRWLKALSFLCCIAIISSVGGRVGYVM